jgi:hypothetical protein
MSAGTRQIGLRDIWVVVKVSSLQRLGKPLLLTYLVLGGFGVAVVAASVLALWIGRR